MISLILIESLLAQYLHDCTSNPEVDVDVLVVFTRSMCLRVDAIIVKSAPLQQYLLDAGHIVPAFGLRSTHQEIVVVRIALQNAGSVAENHLDRDFSAGKKWIFEFIAEDGRQGLIESQLALLD